MIPHSSVEGEVDEHMWIDSSLPGFLFDSTKLEARQNNWCADEYYLPSSELA